MRAHPGAVKKLRDLGFDVVAPSAPMPKNARATTLQKMRKTLPMPTPPGATQPDS